MTKYTEYVEQIVKLQRIAEAARNDEINYAAKKSKS
jgi:hypothetical protein